MIAFLVALYVAIAWHFWYVVVPALAILIAVSVHRSRVGQREREG
jgi:hypothetical protein